MHSMKLFTLLVTASLAFGAAGCMGDDGDDDAAEEARVAPELVDTTAVSGGDRRERALLQRVVADMEQTTLSRVAIAPVEKGDGADVAISFTPVAGRTTVRRQWDAWIVAGAFSRRLLRAGRPAEVAAAGPDGGFTARPKLPRKPDPQPLTRAREAAVVKAVRTAAERTGAQRVRLEIHRPYGVALGLSLVAEDPARFLKTELRPLLARLENPRARLEGVYVAVFDGRRRLALEWGSWTRNPAGSYWVREDLTNCSPIRQSPPQGADEPPPCPA